MPFRFNPFVGNLDFYQSGGIQGPNSSVDKSITRWNGTTGQVIQDSLTVLQDGGGIEAQGFITRRNVTSTITVQSGESWIAPAVELELNGAIEIEPNSEIIVV